MDDKLLIDRLKEVHAKDDTTNFNVLDFISAFGNPIEALAYSKLFWPDFIEFEGMVFLKDIVEDEDDRSQIREALSKLATSGEVEQSFNQFLVPNDFFAERVPGADEGEMPYLASQIATMWRARLTELFPSRKFVVEIQPIEENNEGPTIVVYQA